MSNGPINPPPDPVVCCAAKVCCTDNQQARRATATLLARAGANPLQADAIAANLEAMGVILAPVSLGRAIGAMVAHMQPAHAAHAATTGSHAAHVAHPAPVDLTASPSPVPPAVPVPTDPADASGLLRAVAQLSEQVRGLSERLRLAEQRALTQAATTATGRMTRHDSESAGLSNVP